jgi:aryl-alcohol dehydrogenase-like predicted oxidoreductase
MVPQPLLQPPGSVRERNVDIEDRVLPALRELAVGVTAYGVLSRGLLAGKTSSFAKGGFRAHLPRFAGENLQANLRII